MSNAMRTSMTMAGTMFTYDFMQNAFAAAWIVAVVCGLVGFFLVLRAQTFAGHALSHVGFAGATGAVLIGISPLWGLIALTLAAGIGMGLLGERLHQRDVAIGIVLAMSLGLGLLFLHFFTAYATQATALLFGNILGVDAATVWTLLLLGIAAIAALAVIARPLLFASLQPELAEAKGVSLRLCVGAVPGDRRARRGGMRADRRRSAGVRVDGRPGCGGAAFHHAVLERHRVVGRAGAGRGMAGPGAGILHRLADQLLDHGVEQRRLSGCGAWSATCQRAAREATGSDPSG